jgi:3-oxo-5-alpha-steroid 4-dehydrogenase 3
LGKLKLGKLLVMPSLHFQVPLEHGVWVPWYHPLALIAGCWLILTVALFSLQLFHHCRQSSALAANLLMYGKTKPRGQSFKFNVPKRWFTHFYLVGVCFHTLLLAFMLPGCARAFSPVSPADSTAPYLVTVLQRVGLSPALATGLAETARTNLAHGSNAHVSDALFSTTLCVGLYLLHVLRRAYECCCVSVFSDAQMHVGHYIYGILYYIGE